MESAIKLAELHTDGIAGCLRTPRGGGGRQILFAAGKGRFSVRLLTPRECACLMGADKFVLKVSLNQALFGFGDAVCVPVIEWIARNYLNRVWREEFEPVAPAVATPAGCYRGSHIKEASNSYGLSAGRLFVNHSMMQTRFETPP
jgi:hypothetical protein